MSIGLTKKQRLILLPALALSAVLLVGSVIAQQRHLLTSKRVGAPTPKVSAINGRTISPTTSASPGPPLESKDSSGQSSAVGEVAGASASGNSRLASRPAGSCNAASLKAQYQNIHNLKLISEKTAHEAWRPSSPAGTSELQAEVYQETTRHNRAIAAINETYSKGTASISCK